MGKKTDFKPTKTMRKKSKRPCNTIKQHTILARNS